MSASTARCPWAAPIGVAALAALAAGALALAPAPTAGAWREATLANTALAGSTILYLAHAWLQAEPVGRAASTLAAAGAAGVLLVLARDLAPGGPPATALYEGTALLSALAVFAYLGMERAYRNRSAGALVMAAVMAAVLCEMWLIARGLAGAGAPARGLAAYWETAHRFALALGYGPLVVAALCAALVHARRAPAFATPSTVLAWLSVGVPLLALAAGFGAVWIALERPLPQAVARMALATLAAALGLAAWMRARGPDDPRLPGRAALVFVAASAGLIAAGAGH